MQCVEYAEGPELIDTKVDDVEGSKVRQVQELKDQIANNLIVLNREKILLEKQVNECHNKVIQVARNYNGD